MLTGPSPKFNGTRDILAGRSVPDCPCHAQAPVRPFYGVDRQFKQGPRAMPPPRARFGLTESVVHPRIEFWPDPQTRALLNPRIAERYSNSHAAHSYYVRYA